MNASARDPASYDHFASSAVIHEGTIFIGSADGGPFRRRLNESVGGHACILGAGVWYRRRTY